MRIALCSLIVLFSCSRHGLPTGSGGGGDTAKSCDQLDEAACAQDSRCLVLSSCPDCSGHTTFAQCYDKSRTPPVVSCPKIACASCSDFANKADCESHANCAALSCCHGEFQGCYDKSAPPPSICAGVRCASCASMDEAGCRAADDCALVECGYCYQPGGEFESCTDRNGGAKEIPGECFACADPCRGLDQQACAANPQCQGATCRACDTTGFGCYNKAAGPPPDCPVPPDCGCDGLDEQACAANPSCAGEVCHLCGSSKSFKCHPASDPPGQACPGLGCLSYDCSSESRCDDNCKVGTVCGTNADCCSDAHCQLVATGYGVCASGP